MNCVGDYSGRFILGLYTALLVSIVCVSGNMRYSSKCFSNNNFASVNLTCDNGTVIHVVEVLGGKHTEDSCTVITDMSMCIEVIGPNLMHYTSCNGMTQCNHEVFSQIFRKCHVTAVQVKYECVNKSSILDICADIFMEKNVPNSVIYLKSPGFPSSVATDKECRCIVKSEGNYMSLHILDIIFLYSNKFTPSFIIKNNNTMLWDTGEEKNKSCPFCMTFRQQNLDIVLLQSYMQLFYNNNQSEQNVWIQITGRSNKLITLECNANIISEETTQISSTKQSTSFVTETTSLQTETISTQATSDPHVRLDTSPATETAPSAATTSSSPSTMSMENYKGYVNSTIALAVVAAILLILLVIVSGILFWFVRRYKLKAGSSNQKVVYVITEENHGLRSQTDGVYEIPESQNIDHQRDNAALMSEPSQDRNYDNSPGPCEDMGTLQRIEGKFVAGLTEHVGGLQRKQVKLDGDDNHLNSARLEEEENLQQLTEDRSTNRNAGADEEQNGLQRNSDRFGQGGYVNAGHDIRLSEYETLDPSMMSQNTYERLTAI